MRRIAAVGVDDDFAAGEATIAVRSANHEIAGRVDQEVGRLLRHPAFRQCGLDCVGDQILDHAGRIFLAVAALCIVLRRHHHLGAADRLAVDVLHRTWLLASGCRSNSCLDGACETRTLRILCAK